MWEKFVKKLTVLFVVQNVRVSLIGIKYLNSRGADKWHIGVTSKTPNFIKSIHYTWPCPTTWLNFYKLSQFLVYKLKDQWKQTKVQIYHYRSVWGLV